MLYPIDYERDRFNIQNIQNSVASKPCTQEKQTNEQGPNCLAGLTFPAS
jgi:hypothetical protein